MSDQLKVFEARHGNNDTFVPSSNNAAADASLPAQFYHQLSAVENRLMEEKRANEELIRENRNYRRLLTVREREILKLHENVEKHAEATPDIVKLEQELRQLRQQNDELVDENRTLITVQRAKTRAIEELTLQLQQHSAKLLDAESQLNQTSDVHERLQSTEKALGAAQSELQRQNRLIEKLKARDVGIPTELW